MEYRFPLDEWSLVMAEQVWLKTHHRWAVLISRGAYFSHVCWVEDSIEYEDYVENDDYDFWEERAIQVDDSDE